MAARAGDGPVAWSVSRWGTGRTRAERGPACRSAAPARAPHGPRPDADVVADAHAAVLRLSASRA
ncbi:hypothetical protein QEZ54_21800 [Catellatospora sp. KI3]|uniref:hypothetical protein n=1 Tax=Catellatospora sp. KI3 TaxID=3041620 RepID=UPI00248275F6|nr:hypothetical protein [Catellatospora sp. KI3]MDI1463622.1 hypothetical protein [Catellatospora sp. KI3]